MTQRLPCLLILAGLGAFPALGRAQNDAPRQAPNWYMDLSREFFDAALAQSTDSIDPVHDVILGTWIRGTGRTFARTGVQFIPSDGDAIIDLVTRGTTYTNTVGVNGKINLYNSSTIPFEIRRRVWLNDEGVWTVSSRSEADAHSQLNGLRSNHFILIRPVARAVAKKKYQQSRGEADAIASSRAEGRLNARGDEESQPKLVEANDKFQEKMAEVRKKKVPLRNLHFGTVEHALYMRGVLAAPSEKIVLAAEVPALKRWCFAGLRVHESAVNHTMAETVAGKTYDDKELEKEIGSILGGFGGKKKAPPDEKEWTITFTKSKPVETVFADQGFKVQVRLAEFTSGDNEYSGMNVTVNYKFETKGDKIVAVRQGNIEALPPDFKEGQKLAGRQQVMRTVLQKRFGRLFEPEMVFDQMTLSGDLAKVGPLSPSSVDSARGWLMVTLDQGTARK